MAPRGVTFRAWQRWCGRSTSHLAGRTSTVVDSPVFRVKSTLKRENARPWHEVEEEFENVEYRKVRDRQMRELEMEDDVMGKLPVR